MVNGDDPLTGGTRPLVNQTAGYTRISRLATRLTSFRCVKGDGVTKSARLAAAVEDGHADGDARVRP